MVEQCKCLRGGSGGRHDDAIDPTHYKLDLPGDIEVKDILRAQGILKEASEANVFKYMFRWKNKNGLEDLKKAQVYLGWLIEELE